MTDIPIPRARARRPTTRAPALPGRPRFARWRVPPPKRIEPGIDAYAIGDLSETDANLGGCVERLVDSVADALLEVVDDGSRLG